MLFIRLFIYQDHVMVLGSEPGVESTWIGEATVTRGRRQTQQFTDRWLSAFGCRPRGWDHYYSEPSLFRLGYQGD
jgi:hypothetical protein